MGVIRYKIWHDLWENKGRTLRVIAIIAIGAFAVGTVLGAKEFILQDISTTWQASAPATIGMEVKPAVDDTMIQTLENLKEVEVTYNLGDNIETQIKQEIDKWLETQEINLDNQDELKEHLNQKFENLISNYKLTLESKKTKILVDRFIGKFES